VKRILLVLTVALVMAAMMAVMVAPAFAKVQRVGPGGEFIKKEHSGTFVGGEAHSPPPGR
jgi:opacity protein-like surface antigen